ncbi:MAG: hypothetical protein HRU20_21240 [Pseudomonadales bacterium]|nr:hypothetical protein [Pseudomonadales bacterium]
MHQKHHRDRKELNKTMVNTQQITARIPKNIMLDVTKFEKESGCLDRTQALVKLLEKGLLYDEEKHVVDLVNMKILFTLRGLIEKRSDTLLEELDEKFENEKEFMTELIRKEGLSYATIIKELE